MSPLPRISQEAGVASIGLRSTPSNVTLSTFFDEPDDVRHSYGALMGCDASEVAILPSISYGMTSALSNICPKKNGEALIVHEEFPSLYLSLSRWCGQHQQRLRTILPPPISAGRGRRWNEQILEAITERTSVLTICPAHWSDGTYFDLCSIGKRCHETSTILLVDGTQTTGVLPIDVKKAKIHAYFSATYKSMLGPYGLTLGYFSSYFDQGQPLEEAWINRTNAQSFSALSDYGKEYMPAAGRYNVGQASSFINIAIAKASLSLLLEWGSDNIYTYCRELSNPLIEFIKKHPDRLWIEDQKHRANHLIGMYIYRTEDREAIATSLENHHVKVSLRGEFIRVAIHVYNDENDIQALIAALDTALS